MLQPVLARGVLDRVFRGFEAFGRGIIVLASRVVCRAVSPLSNQGFSFSVNLGALVVLLRRMCSRVRLRENGVRSDVRLHVENMHER